MNAQLAELLGLRAINVSPPVAIVDNASWTTTEVDTVYLGQKANCVVFYVAFGAMDIAMVALKVQETDTSGSGQTDISGADFSVTTLPSATSDNTIFAVYIQLGGNRKRYLNLVATGGNGTLGTYMSSIALLGGLGSLPTTATARGLGGQLIVT